MASAKAQKSVIDPLETGREALRTIGNTAAKTAISEAEESGKTFLQQLLGLDLAKKAGGAHAESKPKSAEAGKVRSNGIEVFDAMKHHGAQGEKPKAHAEKPRANAEAAMNYSHEIGQSSERASKGEMREMSRNIQEIKAELAQLVSSSQVLKLEFAEIGVDQGTPTVGKYQVNFFEWMLVVIRQAREKVEDSGAWLGTVKGKGAKKGYWGMFKQHGTSFGMSGERSVATQVG